MIGAPVITAPIAPKHGTPSDPSGVIAAQAFHLTHAEFEELLSVARPRLVRLARSLGIRAEVADDVVQETLVAAWRHQAELRSPSRFDAWIDSICRNACRMHLRAARSLTDRHEWDVGVSVAGGRRTGASARCTRLEDELSSQMPDPLISDPADELSRHDVQTLLEQALEYLPAELRELVTACYLAETPRDEVAKVWGLSMSALDARLHRARRKLRDVLNVQLRPQALALDLSLDAHIGDGWRETREWCHLCGRSRQYGTFEALPGGGVMLQIQCRVCMSQLNSGARVPIKGVRSFRPAIKRTMKWTAGLLLSRPAPLVTPFECLVCGAATRLQIVTPTDSAVTRRLNWSGLTLVTACTRCGGVCETLASAAAFAHPAAQQFMAIHPRWVAEPEMYAQYGADSALRVRFADVNSTARLHMLLHGQTLRVVGVAEE